MRIAVVHFPVRNDGVLLAISKGITGTLENAGHRVDSFVGGSEPAARLALYEYVLIGTESVGWKGRLPDALLAFLASSGAAPGLRSCAFVRRRGYFFGKTLAALMRAMEAEGMRVNASEALADEREAKARAAELPIEIRRN